MLNKNEILKKIKYIISNKFEMEIHLINPDNSFKVDLGADSLDMIDLVMLLEEEFKIKISEEKIEDIVTINDIFLLIINLLNLND